MKLSDLIIGLILVIFSVTGLVYTNLTFPSSPDGTPGPDLFPNILFSLLCICGVIMMVKSWREKSVTPLVSFPTLNFSGFISILILLLFVVIYINFSDRIGFIPLGFAIIVCLSLWLRVNWRVSLVSAVVTTLVIYVLFVKVLLVPLPQGIMPF